ncbi:hypothetical protein O1L60_03600 [Streptomyces diastatochromogenes]|nr:hypothetical protein [Streptomyces diastatochromogenes]
MSGVPSLVALPLGVWLAAHVGYGPVFAAGAVAALAAVVSVPGLPDRDPAPEGRSGWPPGSGRARCCGPPSSSRPPRSPPASSSPSSRSPSLGLLGRRRHGPVRPVRRGDRRPLGGRPARRPARAGRAPAARPRPRGRGTLLTALTRSPVAVVIGVTLFGIGFGVTQNTTLTLMYARVPASGYGTVSALWNFAFDAGMGVGAVGFGLLAARTGYPAAFALTAALMLTALVPARRDRRTGGAGQSRGGRVERPVAHAHPVQPGQVRAQPAQELP